MSGYTPLFSSLATGTLYGRWPDIGLWAVVLSLADRHGVVDVTPAFLAGVTGLPEADVIACMARFCAPDPGSRTGEEGGARLVLVDSARSWGWRVVNHGAYRERARLMQREVERVQSGENRARMAARRPTLTPDDPRRPPPTHSQTQTQTQTETKDKSASAFGDAPPWLDKQAWSEWTEYRREARKPLTPKSVRQQFAFLEANRADHAAILRQSIRNGWTGLFTLKRGMIPEGPPMGDADKERANRERIAALSHGIGKSAA